MKSITVHPENEKQSMVIEAFLKALKIPFEKSEESIKLPPFSKAKEASVPPTNNGDYNPEWEKIMKRSIKEIEKGDTYQFSMEDLENLWK